MDIINDHPPLEETVELLNSAFGDWGDEKYFRWKYTQYPDFDDSHNFYIEDRGNIIAFTRLFVKELSVGEDDLVVYIWGDSAVAENYRGKGLYSRLKEIEGTRTDKEADIAMSFNTKDKIPYHVHLKDGWTCKQIPLFLKILSPSVVLKHYLEEGLRDKAWLRKFIELFGSRVILDIDGEEVKLSELMEDKEDKKISFKISMKKDRFDSLIESLSSGRYISSFVSDKSEDITVEVPKRVDIEHKSALDSDELDEVMELYNRDLKRSDVHFRRERKDLEHLLKHPHLIEVITVKEDNLKGFAAVARYPKMDITELRVLDILYDDRKTYDILIKEIERCGEKEDADSIFIVSPEFEPSGWIEISNRVVMWDPKEKIKSDNWRISIYDMV